MTRHGDETRTNGGSDTETWLGERPPECVRWHGDGTGTLEVEVTRPFVEWIELEADHAGVAVDEWAIRQLRLAINDSAGDGEETPGGRRENTDTDAATDAEPPECVRWHDDERGTLELEVTEAFVDRMAESAKSSGCGSAIDEWAATHLWVALQEELEDTHGPEVNVEIDVSEAFARRVSLWVKHRDVEEKPIEPADVAFDHTNFDHSWRLDGAPWTLVEGLDD